MLEFGSNFETVGNDEVRIQLLFGRSVCSDVHVADSDLGWFRYLMDNKKERNDLDGFAFNARRCLNLVDSLAYEESLLILDHDEKIVSVIETCGQLLFVGLFVFTGNYLCLFVCACVLLCLGLVATNVVASMRKDAIEQFWGRQLATFQTRLDEYVRKEWNAAAIAMEGTGNWKVMHANHGGHGQSRKVQTA